MAFRGIDKYLLEGKRGPRIMLLVLLFVFNVSSVPAFPVESNSTHPQQLALTQQQAILLTPIHDQRGRQLAGLSIDGLGHITRVHLPIPHTTGCRVIQPETGNVAPLTRLLMRTQTAASEL